MSDAGRDLVYHLAPASQLRSGIRRDGYAPASLASEGFIHCTATRELTLQVAADYFARIDEPLVVLAIDPSRLHAELRYEAPAPIAGGGRRHLTPGVLFPHLYGALNLDAVVGAAALAREGDAFVWPLALDAVERWLG